MRFPLIKRADEADAGQVEAGKDFHAGFESQGGIVNWLRTSGINTDISNVQGPLQALTKSYSAFAVDQQNKKKTNAPDAPDDKKMATITSNIKLLGKMMAAYRPDSSFAEMLEYAMKPDAAPAAPAKKAPKAGPHPGMMALQNKLNEYLKKNPADGKPVSPNGKQSDKATWDTIRKKWPHWFDGNTPKFKNYKTVTDWINGELTKPANAAQAQGQGQAEDKDKYAGVMRSWKNFLGSDPRIDAERKFMPARRGLADIQAKIQEYIKSGSQEPLLSAAKSALISLTAGDLAGVITTLDRAAAAADKQQDQADSAKKTSPAAAAASTARPQQASAKK